MKKVLLVLVLSAIAIQGFGQTTSPERGRNSVGLELGIPTGNAATFEELVLGASYKYTYFLSKSFAVTGSAGINSFVVKDEITGQQGTQQFFSYIPLKVGVKYYLNPSIYLEGQTGGSFYTGSFGSAPLLIVAPGIGYNFGTGIDIALRYESWTNAGNVSQVGARIAYSF